MWFTAIFDVVGNLFGIGRDYLEGKRKIERAKVGTELAIEEARAKSAIKVIETGQEGEIKWDVVAQQNAETSWKDEYLTILVSIPVIMTFVPGLAPYALEGFRILDSTPEWFRYTFGVIVAASFGIRKAADIIGAVKR